MVDFTDYSRKYQFKHPLDKNAAASRLNFHNLENDISNIHDLVAV